MTQVATLLPDPLEEVAPPRGRSGAAAWAIWLLRRIGLAILTLWLVSVLVFLATAALGDPVRAILGRDYDSNVARREQLEAQLGVGDSIITRYLDWLGGLLTGDFGTSLANQQPVWGQISDSVREHTGAGAARGRGDDPAGLRHRDDLRRTTAAAGPTPSSRPSCWRWPGCPSS